MLRIFFSLYFSLSTLLAIAYLPDWPGCSKTHLKWRGDSLGPWQGFTLSGWVRSSPRGAGGEGRCVLCVSWGFIASQVLACTPSPAPTWGASQPTSLSNPGRWQTFLSGSPTLTQHLRFHSVILKQANTPGGVSLSLWRTPRLGVSPLEGVSGEPELMDPA